MSASESTSGSGGITRSLMSTVKSTRPLISILVPSAGCMISLEITSGSWRFIFLAISSPANSATLLEAGKNMVRSTVPSPIHSTSGLILEDFLSSSVSLRRTFTLSFSSSSSIKIILSGSSNVHPPISAAGFSIAAGSYCATLLYPKCAVTGAK